MLAIHLMIFSILTVYNQLDKIDWGYLKKSFPVLIIPKIFGVLGLLSLPNEVLIYIIYGITFMYGVSYLLNHTFRSNSRLVDNLLLVLGGYASGVSLMGAPLVSAVYTRHVALENLRTTLFFLWMVLVAIKMSTFVAFGVDLQFRYAMYSLPVVGLGHWIGLRIHKKLIEDGGDRYKRVLGLVLVAICSYGIIAAR